MVARSQIQTSPKCYLGQVEYLAKIDDIMHLVADGVPVMGLDVDRTRYFWYHHTAADTVDKVDKDSFNRCVAASAIMMWIVADMPQRLPR